MAVRAGSSIDRALQQEPQPPAHPRAAALPDQLAAERGRLRRRHPHQAGRRRAAILRRLKTDGPLSTAAFSEHGHAVDWWWRRPGQPRGHGGAVRDRPHRHQPPRRNRRYYDLIERLVPPRLLKLKESEESAMTHRLLSRFRATGMTMPSGRHAVGGDVQRRPDRRPRAPDRQAGRGGHPAAVEIEGMKATRYILAEEEYILDATADPASLEPGVSFLGPLDPLIWDRKGILRGLFEFDYLWEVYVPEAKRNGATTSFPCCSATASSGASSRGSTARRRTLAILGIWFEPGFEPMETPGFSPPSAMRSRRTGPSSAPSGSPGRAPARVARSVRRCGRRQSPDTRVISQTCPKGRGPRRLDGHRGSVGARMLVAPAATARSWSPTTSSVSRSR